MTYLHKSIFRLLKFGLIQPKEVLWQIVYNSLYAFVISLWKREDANSSPKILLVSYPRSGSNWTRYVIEFLTKRPTPGHFRLIIGKRRMVFDRSHIWENQRSSDAYDKLVLLIRNYKECLIRHHDQKFKEAKTIENFFLLEGRQAPIQYLSNIKDFDLFKGEKLLLYYEDLIIKTETEFVKLLKFLDIKVPSKRLKKFFANLDYHRKLSIMLYKLNQESVTGGSPDKTIYHSKTLTEEQKKEFDEFFKNYDYNIFVKYLLRYNDV
jgi:hypothetical protein